VLLDARGCVLLHHRKINELDIAHDLYGRGDRLGVATTPWGRLGLMICADGFARGQIVSRTLGAMGARVILSPCAWAVPADHDNAREPYGRIWLENYGVVARDCHLWIAGCSNVGWIEDGPWRGRKCIGSSLVIGPTGDPILRGPYGVEAETILFVDVNPESAGTDGVGAT
jgi:predicted amidohydrolase